MNAFGPEITREKHLDHMVKVVPLLVLAYAIQAYFIFQIKGPEFTKDCMVLLGLGLIFMILSFIVYDTKHHVQCFENHLMINFLFYHHSINYHEITRIVLDDDKSSFSKLTLHCQNGKKFHFYFIDDGDKIKEWINSKTNTQSLAA